MVLALTLLRLCRRLTRASDDDLPFLAVLYDPIATRFLARREHITAPRERIRSFA